MNEAGFPCQPQAVRNYMNPAHHNNEVHIENLLHGEILQSLQCS